MMNAPHRAGLAGSNFRAAENMMCFEYKKIPRRFPYGYQRCSVANRRNPAGFAKIDHLLLEKNFTIEELAMLANAAVGVCFCEFRSAVDPEGYGLNPEFRTVHIDNLCSNSPEQVLECLLRHGYDPNISIGEENAFWDLKYVDTPNVGARCMRLLLENGADPNLIIVSEPGSLFENIDFDVNFENGSRWYYNTVQCWLVLMAYGGHLYNGTIPVKMLNGNPVEIFKGIELFDYSIEDLPNNCWRMNIFNAKTGEKVAQY